MLEEKCINSRLSEILVSREDFRPFPTSTERASWERLPDGLGGRIVAEAERHLESSWDQLPATWYMDYVRNGNRSRYESRYRQRRAALMSLALAECVEDRGRFLNRIVDAVWFICEESSWVIPAHNVRIETGKTEELPDVEAEYQYVDLFSAETAALLAWVSYLLKDRLDSVSPLVARRIRSEVQRRVFRSYLERDDFWWMGFDEESQVRQNNWNTWINANCLAAFLVLEENPDVRATAVAKCMRSLDRFVDDCPGDGGCDEGPLYWGAAGASLFDCLELLHIATNGVIDVYSSPLIQDIGRYIYRVHIAGQYYVNFADATAVLSIPAGVAYRYGCRIGDSGLKALGLYSMGLRNSESNWFAGFHVFRSLCDICDHPEQALLPAEPHLEQDVWLSEIQVMAARERGGDAEGLYIAAKGGHNGESHNHNDVGQFMIYSDGKPAIIDAGVGDYSAKTFSSSRYEIWTMQSAYHNLPTVNGIQQEPGESARALKVDYSCEAGSARLCLDIASAYPKEAGIATWKRCYTLHRGNRGCVEIADEFRLSKETDDIALSLMTNCEHDLETPGVIGLRVEGGKDLIATYDASVLSAVSERIETVDAKLSAAWGDHVHRITLRSRNATDSGTWVMRFEQAVDACCQ